MKIISLDKKSIRAFEGLDPLELYDARESSFDIMLGAVIPGSGKDVPVGLLFAEAEGAGLTLRWLFVDPDSRGKSCGEQLLSAVFRIAEERGQGQLAVHFPEVYGYGSFCRNDRSYLLAHGFRETEEGGIISTLEDYHKATEYSEPSDPDEEEMLDLLLVPGWDEEEEQEVDLESLSPKLHKPWEVRSVGLREFSKMPSLQKLIRASLAGREAMISGNIGELSFPGFREGIELCEKNGHTGFLKSLFDTPVEYFDMDVSSYTMADGRVSGMCLAHYNKAENCLSVEMIYTSDNDNLRGLAELIRVFLLSANKKYDPDTRLILPYDEKLHKPLINTLFGE